MVAEVVALVAEVVAEVEIYRSRSLSTWRSCSLSPIPGHRLGA